MEEQFERSELILGREGIARLHDAKVAVFGVGGVGSFVVEALARAGVGHIVMVDNDVVAISNINRQIHATYESVGKYKVEEMKKRVQQIYPACNVMVYKVWYSKDCEDKIIDESFDYVVDAVDCVSAKLEIIKNAKKCGVKVISAMGTGNKLDPTRFEVGDIFKTSVCPLAKVMRKMLKKENITDVKVVYSKEEPICNNSAVGVVGSVSFVPSVVGLIIAGEVVKDVLNLHRKMEI